MAGINRGQLNPGFFNAGEINRYGSPGIVNPGNNRGSQVQSQTIPDELKKRAQSAAKEFNFKTEDIGHLKKALHDQNYGNSGKASNPVQGNVNNRVGAAIDKYKFTPEEIAAIEKSGTHNGVHAAGLRSCNGDPSSINIDICTIV